MILTCHSLVILVQCVVSINHCVCALKCLVSQPLDLPYIVRAILKLD